MKTFNCLILLAFLGTIAFGQNTRRWSFSEDNGIVWDVKPLSPHNDHIEMSGLQISAIVGYGVSDSGVLTINKKLVFPMLRTIPNNTHASLIVDFTKDQPLQMVVNDTELKEYPKSFGLKGKLIIKSLTNTKLETTHILFPSVDKPSFIEIINLQNKGNTEITVNIKKDIYNSG